MSTLLAAPRLGHHKSKLKDAPTHEVPKWRACLAPGHNHMLLTTKDRRLCDLGRQQTAGVDPIYGFATGVSRVIWAREAE